MKGSKGSRIRGAEWILYDTSVLYILPSPIVIGSRKGVSARRSALSKHRASEGFGTQARQLRLSWVLHRPASRDDNLFIAFTLEPLNPRIPGPFIEELGR